MNMANRVFETRKGSIYSAAPSIQPSLAPTNPSPSSSNRSSYNHDTPMAGSRLSGPPSYYESYPFATPEKNHPQFVYNCNPDSAALASTMSLSNSTDPRAADIKHWSGTLERMQDARFEKQRYIMSGHKSEEVSMLALGAKVERALARRMVGQDASFRTKTPVSSSTTATTTTTASKTKIENEKRHPSVKAS